MSGHKPFSILREQLDQNPDGRRMVGEIKLAYRDAERLMELRAQRKLTQQEVADSLNVSQANISRIEHEDDLYLSTLRAYIEAMGGELEILARFPDGEVIKVS